MKKLIFLTMIAGLIGLQAQAKVSALFHPYDPALESIARHFSEAQSSIDIAMYNMDTEIENPIIAALSTPEIQSRLKSRELKIRIVFEGYGSEEKMQKLEDLGMDVKRLRSSRKVHHKFAVIDSTSLNPILITGSANWSLSSQNFYNENILFFEDELAVTINYQKQFDLLWGISKEFGNAYEYDLTSYPSSHASTSSQSYFNTDNFEIEGRTLKVDATRPGFVLTRELVRAIDGAKSKIEVATTRIKLRPVYEALIRAAQRGVKIKVLVTMGEYETRAYRLNKTLPTCEVLYSEECSIGENYSTFLSRSDFSGHENIEVRFKFFNLDHGAYLSEQMHSKYLIVDDSLLLTGSFNWSYSSEYGHIENLLRIPFEGHQDLLNQFNRDFSWLWDLNRSSVDATFSQLAEKILSGEKIDCDIESFSLSAEEIDQMVELIRSSPFPIAELCQNAA